MNALPVVSALCPTQIRYSRAIYTVICIITKNMLLNSSKAYINVALAVADVYIAGTFLTHFK